jgi:predicted Zn-dependent protease
MGVRTLTVGAIGLAAAASLAGCTYNPALGRNQLLLVDNSALAQAASQAWTEALRTQAVSNNPALTQRVRAVGSRLVAAAGLADRQWDYRVFDDDQANAFVLPGGQIGVNTGLLSLVENDDQLAAVLGHEIAHMTASHAAERYSQTAATQVLLSGASAALGGGESQLARGVASLGGVGAQLGVLLPFSRQHELEADRLGLEYMNRAGYRPSEAVRLWTSMSASRQGGAPPTFMSTHPSDQQRIAALQSYIQSRGWS